MANKHLVTQGELNNTIAGLGALADNLSQHVNQSFSEAHGWSIVDSAYFDTGGNYHTDFGNNSTLVPIPGVYNTGVNNDNTLATPGSVDLHWTLVQSASKTYPGPDAPIITPLPSGYASSGPNSQAIGARVSGTVSDGTYKFRLTFNLTGLNAATAIINGVWSSDNTTKAVLLNGNTTGYTCGSGTQKKQPANQFQLNGGFLPGVNTLEFVVSNSDGPVSLRVELTGRAAVGGVFSIPGVYNTGVTDSGSLDTLGGPDKHWTLIQSADSGNPGPNAIVISKLDPTWSPNTSVSQWIGPRTDASVNAPAGDYVYRLTFDLTGYIASTALVKGTFVSDDITTQVLLNGQVTGVTNTTTNLSNTKKYTTSFVLASGFQAGTNTLDFKVNNKSGGGTGLRVELTGTASPSGTNVTSRVLRLTIGGEVFYIPAQLSGGIDGQADPTIQQSSGIVSPQSADPAYDLTVGSPTVARIVTAFADTLNAISQSASDALVEHAGSAAESVHGGLSWQTEQTFTSAAYLVGRRTVNITIDGVPYKIVADTNVKGPLNS